MIYGENAIVGNLAVINREGAIEAYKLLCKIAAKYRTPADTRLLDEARQDMISLGFTASECTKIELAA